jgi:hypothetical protein
MKIQKDLAIGKTKGQLAQLHAAAAAKEALARQFENQPDAKDYKIIEMIEDAGNECPCADELIRLSDFDSPEIEVWGCPHCKGHHYFNKE